MGTFINNAAITQIGRTITSKLSPIASYKSCDNFYSPEEIMKANTKTDVRYMLEKLSGLEQTRLCFLPLVYSRIAWLTADEVLRICVTERIGHTKKQVRVIKELYKDYMSMLRLDLDEECIQRIIVAADDVIEQSGMTYYQLYLCCKNAIDKLDKSLQNSMLSANAVRAAIICEVMQEHNIEMARTLGKKIGNSSVYTPKQMLELRDRMWILAGVRIKWKENPDIVRCIAVFKNILKNNRAESKMTTKKLNENLTEIDGLCYSMKALCDCNNYDEIRNAAQTIVELYDEITVNI